MRGMIESSMISRRAWGGDIRLVPFSFSGHSNRFFGILSYWHAFSPIFRTFCPIYGHFRSVSGHFPAMSAIGSSPAPFRPARRYSVPLSRAVCLKKIAPPIG